MEKVLVFDDIVETASRHRMYKHDNDIGERESLIDLLLEAVAKAQETTVSRGLEHPTQASDSARLILALQQERDDLRGERDEIDGQCTSLKSRINKMTRELRGSREECKRLRKRNEDLERLFKSNKNVQVPEDFDKNHVIYGEQPEDLSQVEKDHRAMLKRNLPPGCAYLLDCSEPLFFCLFYWVGAYLRRMLVRIS